MANRGQGRGRGSGGRAQPPPPASGRGPSAGRGGAPRSATNPPPRQQQAQPPRQQQQAPPPSHPSQFPPLGASSSAQFPPLAGSSVSLGQDFQRKLTVTPAPSPVRPSVQAAPVRAPSSVQGAPVVAPARPPPSVQGARPSVQGARPSVQAVPARPSVQAVPGGQVAVPARPSVQAVLAPVGPSVQPVPTRAPTSSKALSLPLRPGYGTLGKKIMVRANHFLVTVADRELYHYDVTITPEVTSKKVCRLIMQELDTCYRESHLGKRHIAYDGVKSMYTAGELPFSSKDFVVKLAKDDNVKRDREFKVAIKFAAKPDLHHLQQFLNGRQSDSPQETIQALDVVLRSKPSIDYTVVGRSFFDKVLGDTGSLGEGLEYWKGFYQSLRPTQMGLSLNIDVSARAFFEPILVTEFASRYCNVRSLARPLSDKDRIMMKKALRGIKVVLTTNERGRRYKVNGFTTQPLRQLTFVDDTGSRVSVVQYFHDKYHANLTLTALPAIQAGNDSKPLYLPMELCKIVSGQRYTKKLSERQVTALLRATCQRPTIREDSIKRMVGRNNYSHDEVAKDFGIQVNTELESVEARVLPPPQLQYLGSLENPRVGSWNMINKKMVNGAKIDFWAIVNFSDLQEREQDIFWNSLVRKCQEKGIAFNPMPIVPPLKTHPSQIRSALSDIHTQSKAKITSIGHAGKQLQLLIVILPDAKGSYGIIKLICETELGIVSQCCQPREAHKCNGQYLENLSLKINVKAGGRNTVLLTAIQKKIPNVTDRPTIIIGADVTHPAPGEDSSASIAAVVASMDWPEVTKYRALVSAQPHRDEIIHDLYTCIQNDQGVFTHGGLIRDHLMAFNRSTGLKPHRIIFYRDGVSEGQFSQVLWYEMDAIRKACYSLEKDYMPPVTFVVVQKRHHTRLFPANHSDRGSTDRSGNILPGTVVDKKICHPTEFDFYLNSHAGIQGTSRPAHYHVLFDENRFTADQLQSLTNNLCYTYARCTRSVSIVPAAYYAHLAAFRARYYVEGNATTESESVSGGGNATRERVAAVRAIPGIKDNVKEVMFYC